MRETLQDNGQPVTYIKKDICRSYATWRQRTAWVKMRLSIQSLEQMSGPEEALSQCTE